MAVEKNLFNVSSLLIDLTCSICLEYFKNPNTLTCQHSYCSTCLEPLLKNNSIVCPQCRAITYCREIKNIPKNTLLSNLVTNLQNSAKAACPICKTISFLIICEHCSQVYCKSCKDVHLKKLIENLDKKFNDIINIPKKLDNLKLDLDNAEKETLENTIKKLDDCEKEFLSLMKNRKLALIEQINRFYCSKSKKIEASKENMKKLTFEYKLLIKKFDEFKAKANIDFFKSNNKNEKILTKELADLETKVSSLEFNYNILMPQIDINNNSLKIVCDKINNFEIYSEITKKIYFETSKDDKLILEAAKKNDNALKYELELKTIFGNPILIEHHEDKISIEDLKEKFAKQVGLNDPNSAIFLKDDSIIKPNTLLYPKIRKSLKPHYRKSKILHSDFDITNNDDNNNDKTKSKIESNNIIVLHSNKASTINNN